MEYPYLQDETLFPLSLVQGKSGMRQSKKLKVPRSGLMGTAHLDLVEKGDEGSDEGALHVVEEADRGQEGGHLHLWGEVIWRQKSQKFSRSVTQSVG